MELRGRLVYDCQVGDSYRFVYVTMEATVFSTSVFDWLLDGFTDVFNRLTRYDNVLTDVLTGLLGGVAVASADDILALIPETIQADTTNVTLAYLNLSTPEYFSVPFDLRLAYISADTRCLGAVIPSLTDLSILAMEGVSVYYKRVLTPDLVVPVTNPLYDYIDVYDGRYTAYFPAASSLAVCDPDSGARVSGWQTQIMSYFWADMGLSVAGILHNPEPPVNSFFSPGADLSIVGDFPDITFSCFRDEFSSLPFYTPYQAGYPSDDTLSNAGLVRNWRTSYTDIKRIVDYTIPAGFGLTEKHIMVKPKPELVPGGIYSGGGIVTVAALAALAAQTYMQRIRRKNG